MPGLREVDGELADVIAQPQSHETQSDLRYIAGVLIPFQRVKNNIAMLGNKRIGNGQIPLEVSIIRIIINVIFGTVDQKTRDVTGAIAELKGMGFVERLPVIVGHTHAECSFQCFIGGQIDQFMIQGAVRQVFRFAVVKPKKQSLFLFFVDIRYSVV